ncbi:MAG: nickel-dependent hydrogenase large subunit [Polyangiaceae bacterium]
MNDSDVIRVSLGPQHPALKEPSSFLLSLRGERVTELGVRLGYNHRGMEKACEERSYLNDLYLLERICGICSHAHTSAYVAAVEEIAEIQVPRRGLYLRTLVGELERIHSHLLWLGVAGHEIGFDTLLMYSWRDREIVMDVLADLTGNRVNYGYNTIGGVRRDIDEAQERCMSKALDTLEERTKYYAHIATHELTLAKRLSGVGRISKNDVLRLGVTGPTARASGVARDVRKDDPYAIYGELDFEIVTADTCDVFGRTIVRVGELLQSYRIIRQILKELPEGPITNKAPRKIPKGHAVSRYEAPRGEDVHYVRANGTDKPERVKVRAPTMVNIQAVAYMMKGGYLADMPITLAAIDPCFSCTDRMVELVDEGGSSLGVKSWSEIRSHGIRHYRDLGIDLGDVSKRLTDMMERL